MGFFLSGLLGTPDPGVGYMEYLNDIPQQLMDKMWFEVANIPVFFTWIVAYITGFLLYTYAGKVTKEQGVQPYPLWIHCYMFSIDTIGVLTYGFLAITHHFYWYFDLQVIALAMWLMMEYKSISAGIKDKDEREFEFGRYRKGGVSEKQARFYCIGIFACGFVLNMWCLSLMGGMANCAIWIIYPFTVRYKEAQFHWTSSCCLPNMPRLMVSGTVLVLGGITVFPSAMVSDLRHRMHNRCSIQPDQSSQTAKLYSRS